ncbi:Clavaminate synthase-like protein [Venturia nashicola]|nr:Clavaminate synthase-like protein [Venturia nashicola]
MATTAGAATTGTTTLSHKAVQPDISYAPDFAKYQARTKKRLANEKLHEQSLPPGFPTKLEGDFVWDGDSIQGTYEWVHKLSHVELAEVEDALRYFKSLNQGLGFVNEETFPLPRLHPILRDVSKELHYGHGFKVIRGLPVDKHTREDNFIIYAGISSHIAPDRGRQDSKFHGKPADVVLAHIKDLSNTAEKGNIGSPAYTTDKQVFHTDVGEIVSLLCLNPAAEGGQSKVASNWRVYNEFAATRPDLIKTLSEPWIADGFGRPNKPYTIRPLLYHQPATSKSPERVIVQYARRSFTGFQALSRTPTIPPITEAQAEALDALHFTAERLSLGLDFQKGDIQYINNLVTFHARDGFKDTAEQQRHLVRLWLRDPEHGWEMPEPLRSRWDEVYAGVTPEKQVFPLEPGIRSASNGAENKQEDVKTVSG